MRMPMKMTARSRIGVIPFLAVLAGWWLLPRVLDYPEYMLPPIGTVLDLALESIRDGSLAYQVGASLLLEDVVLAVQLAFAVVNAALFALDFFATATDLDLPFLAQLDQFFFAAQNGGLAHALRLALRLADDSLGALFSGCLSRLLPFQLCASPKLSAEKEKNRTGN